MKTLLIRDVNEIVHLKFKTHCVARGLSMSEVLRDFMKATVGTAEGPIFPDGAKSEQTINIENKE